MSATAELPGLNLAAVFEAIAAQVPERECIVFRDRRLTYGEVAERSRRLAHVLHDHGLGAHAPTREGFAGHESHMDHLAIYAYNGNEYLEAMLGAFEARVAPVNVNYRYVAEELRYVLADSQAKAIVYQASFAPVLAQVLPQLGDVRLLLQIDDESGHDLLPGAISYEAALAAASPERPEWADEWSPDDLYVLYTGGTTGMPKGVLWRQGDIHRTSMGGRDPVSRAPWANIEALVELAVGPRRQVVCAAAPFMHGAGHWVAFGNICQGNTVVIQDVVDRLDADDICGVIEREKVSFLQIVGDAFGRPIVEVVEQDRYDLSSLVVLLSGGAALSAGVKERFFARLPDIILVDGLGSSEGGGQGMQVRTATGLASSGTFTPSEGSVVVSEDLSRVLEAGADEIGWLAKRIDAPLGYLGDADKTERTFPLIAGERMSVPGDRARWSSDGSLELLGRDSATINSGGEKIFAEEVEAAIVRHPAVADAVVVGRPSERWGSEVVAIVEMAVGRHATEAELSDTAATAIARYKLPKAWVFVEQIQRSPAGKADLRWAQSVADRDAAPPDATADARVALIEKLTAAGAPFEVCRTEVDGAELRTWANAPGTLRDVLVGTTKHGDRDFLVYGDERWTYAEHLADVGTLARWLRDIKGVAKGDRIAIAMRNYPEWIISFWATQALGAVAVPLNAWWTAPELRFALEDSGATVAVVDGERYQRLEQDLRDLDVHPLVVRPEGPVASDATHWPDAVGARVADTAMPDADISADDDATIVYTSGTTGRPKGAVSSHRNHASTFMNTAFTGALAAAGAPAASHGVDRPAPAPPCSLMTYPFFHIGGLNTVYLSTGFGTKMVLQYKWDLEEALRLIERERVTSIAVVPTLLRQMLESPLLDKFDVSSLGTIASGGAPVPPDLVARIDETFDSAVRPSNGYGLTETTGAVTLNLGKAYLDRSTSVGVPYPVTDVRAVDPENGDEVAVGEVGELWFHGPTVSRGYWNDPGSTAQAFTDGWFHSGDLGFIDSDGFVSVVDRLKDVIIRGGENVYCAEVEAVLFEHPAVQDVAVVGVPHHELGEEVAAVVQVRDAVEVSGSELQAHVADRLAYFKVPALVVFRVQDLPRNATGKLLKRDLRDELRNRPEEPR